MSGIVWTYPSNGGSNATNNYGHTNSSNSTNNNNGNSLAVAGAGPHPYIAQVPYNRVADGGNGVAGAGVANNNNNNGNNNLIGQQQQALAPAVAQQQQQQQMAGFRLPASDNDTANSSGVNHSLEENKKYKVSVSFDR